MRKNSPKNVDTWNPTDSGLGKEKPLCNKNVASGEEMNGRCNSMATGRDDGTEVMTGNSSSGMTRRALLGAFAATALTAAPTYSNAAGFLRGGGDIRRIRMYSGRTGERIDMIYWIEGQYI